MPQKSIAKRNEKAIAVKAIAIAPHLTGSDKTVAAIIIDHYNLKTGRCDPGLERLALLSGLSEKTVRRGLKKLAGGLRQQNGRYEHPVLIRKTGYNRRSNTMTYMPNFQVCEEAVLSYESLAKLSTQQIAKRIESGSEGESQFSGPQFTGQNCHQERTNQSEQEDRHDHQTHIGTQLITQTDNPSDGSRKATNSSASKHLRDNQYNHSISHREMASKEANKRIQAGLKSYLTKADYELLISTLDSGTEQAAIDAEVNRKGAGLVFLIEYWLTNKAGTK